MAKGHRPPAGINRKVSVTFDDASFEFIQQLAEENQCSFAEMVRRQLRYAMAKRGEHLNSARAG